MKPKPTRATAATPSQIHDLFVEDPTRVTDAQLLVLLLGRGSSRSAKGLAKKTWTAIELAHDLLATAGGRLEHLVASARRADFDRRSFALGGRGTEARGADCRARVRGTGRDAGRGVAFPATP